MNKKILKNLIIQFSILIMFLLGFYYMYYVSPRFQSDLPNDKGSLNFLISSIGIEKNGSIKVTSSILNSGGEIIKKYPGEVQSINLQDKKSLLFIYTKEETLQKVELWKDSKFVKEIEITDISNQMYKRVFFNTPVETQGRDQQICLNNQKDPNTNSSLKFYCYYYDYNNDKLSEINLENINEMLINIPIKYSESVFYIEYDYKEYQGNKLTIGLRKVTDNSDFYLEYEVKGNEVNIVQNNLIELKSSINISEVSTQEPNWFDTLYVQIFNTPFRFINTGYKLDKTYSDGIADKQFLLRPQLGIGNYVITNFNNEEILKFWGIEYLDEINIRQIGKDTNLLLLTLNDKAYFINLIDKSIHLINGDSRINNIFYSQIYLL